MPDGDRPYERFFAGSGRPAIRPGNFFVAGRFDKMFCQTSKIAQFGLGNFCRRVPRAKIRRNRGSPVRVARRPSGHLIISPLSLGPARFAYITRSQKSWNLQTTTLAAPRLVLHTTKQRKMSSWQLGKAPGRYLTIMQSLQPVSWNWAVAKTRVPENRC